MKKGSELPRMSRAKARWKLVLAVFTVLIAAASAFFAVRALFGDKSTLDLGAGTTFTYKLPGSSKEVRVFKYPGKTFPFAPNKGGKLLGSDPQTTAETGWQEFISSKARVLLRSHSDLLLGPPNKPINWDADLLALVNRNRDERAAQWYAEVVAPYIREGLVSRVTIETDPTSNNPTITIYDSAGERQETLENPDNPDMNEPFAYNYQAGGLRSIWVDAHAGECSFTDLPLQISGVSQLPCGFTMAPAEELLEQELDFALQGRSSYSYFAGPEQTKRFPHFTAVLAQPLLGLEDRLAPGVAKATKLRIESGYVVADSKVIRNEFWSAFRMPATGKVGKFSYEIKLNLQDGTAVVELFQPSRADIIKNWDRSASFYRDALVGSYWADYLFWEAMIPRYLG